MIVLTTAFVLTVSPVIVILTHGPAAHAHAASMNVAMVEAIATHGHAHGHGHMHDEAGHDHHSGSIGGHSPGDHDHPLHALICQPKNAAGPLLGKAQCALSEAFRHLTPEGPTRPPRAV